MHMYMQTHMWTYAHMHMLMAHAHAHAYAQQMLCVHSYFLLVQAEPQSKSFAQITMNARSFSLSSTSEEGAKSVRKRGTANLSVTDHQYKEALYEALVNDPPIIDMRHKLGPKLCQHVKQVEPSHLISLHKAWMSWINLGCKNLVLQSKKMLGHWLHWHVKTHTSSQSMAMITRSICYGQWLLMK